MTTQEAAVLTKLYQLAVVWKEQKERNEVQCSCRMALFLGLLQGLDRLRSLEQENAEAKAVKERIQELGYAYQPEGMTELHWPYMRWNQEKGALERVQDLEPMLQSQVVSTIIQLQATIVGPNVLQKFHSTRRMAAAYQGETVTFLLSIGLRDVMASQAWGMLTTLCGNASSKIIGLRMRPIKMDRQPIAKVVAERFPPPPERSQGQRYTQRQSEAVEEKNKSDAEL
ncbi:unnamed protein product [Symbiodinium necroappetens]|uniref:Uncharacterized protein n=1 Tax=Symbiodinium necroappetens TaxID=1628268 RepID=A0A813B450_9DINO|nr:unnamed protein product [Symbiodinium necroappetens]